MSKKNLTYGQFFRSGKKIFLIFGLVILLTGCSVSQDEYKLDEKTASPEMSTQNEEIEAMKRINELKEGATPKIKTETKKIESQTNKQNNNNNQMDLENLSQTYTQALIKTSLGDIKVKFYGKESPKTVNNFLKLAKEGFYNGTLFHRVISDFMIQGGDPNSKDEDWATHGMGGPGYKFEDEFNDHKLVRGSLAMANSGPNTNGSQFFIVTIEATPWLDGKHTNFGYVVEGMDTVEKIEAVEKNERDHPLEDVEVEAIELLK